VDENLMRAVFPEIKHLNGLQSAVSSIYINRCVKMTAVLLRLCCRRHHFRNCQRQVYYLLDIA